MKNLKMFSAAIAIFVVSLLAGCSDQLASLGETENLNSGKKNGNEVVPTVENLSADRFHRIQIRLKSHSSFTFNKSNTGFDEIHSVDIENLSLDPNIDEDKSECQNIAVYESSDGKVFSCHSKGLKATQIIVENTGSKMIDLEVALVGLRKRIPVPVDSE